MKKYWLILAALALVAACGGSSDDKKDVAGEDINRGEDAAGDVQQTTDNITPEDGLGDDVDEGSDSAADTVQPPEFTYSDHIYNRLCEDYCNSDLACDGIEYGEACLAACIETAQGDDTFAKQIACARNAIEDGDFCTALTECTGDYEYNETCVTLCDQVVVCEALGGTMFGDTLEDCALVCTSSVGLNPMAEPVLSCIAAALQNCSGTEFMACVGAEEENTVCTESFCGEAVDPGCALIPDTYADAETCIAECADWSVGQGMAADMCLGFGTELPIECAPVFANCFAVPDAPLEGSLEYCKLMAAKCGGVGGDEMYNELGGLAHDVCAWVITGIVSVKPDAFQPMADAVSCMEALEICPSGDLGNFFCLFDVTEEHVASCSSIADLCEDETLATETVMECEGTLGFAAGFVPEAVEQIAMCVENAASCDDVTQCFFGDEE